MNVIAGLNWSEPATVTARGVPKQVRSAPATKSFWDAWKRMKPDLQAVGLSVAKDERTNEFVVKYWIEHGQQDLAQTGGRATNTQHYDAPSGYQHQPPQQHQVHAPAHHNGHASVSAPNGASLAHNDPRLPPEAQHPAVQAVMQTLPVEQVDVYPASQGQHNQPQHNQHSAQAQAGQMVVQPTMSKPWHAMSPIERLRFNIETSIHNALESGATQPDVAALLADMWRQVNPNNGQH